MRTSRSSANAHHAISFYLGGYFLPLSKRYKKKDARLPRTHPTYVYHHREGSTTFFELAGAFHAKRPVELSGSTSGISASSPTAIELPCLCFRAARRVLLICFFTASATASSYQRPVEVAAEYLAVVVSTKRVGGQERSLNGKQCCVDFPGPFQILECVPFWDVWQHGRRPRQLDRNGRQKVLS